jgi:hypothetical protein
LSSYSWVFLLSNRAKMVGVSAGALLSAIGLLSSIAEAGFVQAVPELESRQVAETTSPNYINASDHDNSPVSLKIDLKNKSARNKTSP